MKINGTVKKVAAGGTAGLTLTGLISTGVLLMGELRERYDKQNKIRAEINQIQKDSCGRDDQIARALGLKGYEWNWYEGRCVRED